MRIDSDILVQQFLDGDLPSDEEAEALRRIAQDPEMRSLLRFDARLRRTIVPDAGLSPDVPAGFSDQVMQAIARAEAADKRATHPGYLQRAWEALIRPRPVTWRPAYTVPMLALLIGLAIMFTSREAPPLQPEDSTVATSDGEGRTAYDGDQTVLVRFIFMDEEARSVAVAGDFNYWEPMPLTRQEVGGQVVWSGLKAVPHGEYRYMFVIDGEEWVTDPLASEVRDDGFGHKNAVLSL